MISFRQLSLYRGSKCLFSEADLLLHAGHKIGITGVNGCGKSSLFALILGHLQADQGSLDLPSGQTIAHVKQETDASEQSILDYVLDGDQAFRAAQQALRQAEDQGDGHQIAQCHAHLDHLGAFAIESKVAQILYGLGFVQDDHQKAVSQFSGGWRMRLNLAQALLCPSDILLLDEPTNHLDLDAVIWLEGWLSRYAGTLLLISHDREFLDGIVNHVIHFQGQTLVLYKGNYSDFERKQLESLSQQQQQFEKQQQQRAQLEKFISRFRAKASKAKQAQSRLKTLEKLDDIAAVQTHSPFSFRFLESSEYLSDPLMYLKEVDCGYDGITVLEKINFTLMGGSRIGLLGRNGQGKSTLIKLLANELSITQGTLEKNPKIRIGYFAQHQLEQLEAEQSPLQHITALSPDQREQKMRDFLGGFAFNHDMVNAPIGRFSGGEKARLVLALMLWQRPDVLLLDEPTNHLDMEMRHALTLALQNYQGALVIVSHDRHLLSAITDQFYLVDQQRVTAFDGDLQDYQQWLTQSDKVTGAANIEPKAENNRREQRRQEAELRKKTAPLRNQIKKIERQMEALEEQQQQLEKQLAEPDLYEEGQKGPLNDLLQQQGTCHKQHAACEEKWFLLHEQLEA
jgi:ATP-binding cassette, subfamily F, member 3